MWATRKSILNKGALGLLLSLCAMLCVAHAAAQNQQPKKKNQNKWEGQRTTPTPTPTPNPNRNTHTGHRTTPVVQRVGPLTLEWRLLRFTDDGLRKVASIDEPFSLLDHLVFTVKVKQNGYLYVLRQTAQGAEGMVLFPSKYYNEGRNFVRQDQEFSLPSNCTDNFIPCWFNLQPHAGKETLTLVFSREQVTGLPNYDSASAPALPVRAGFLYSLQQAGAKQQLERSSVVQRLPKTPGILGDRFATVTVVQNTSAGDNKEIIETLSLNKTASVNTASATGQD
jgi:hypothetical protein